MLTLPVACATVGAVLPLTPLAPVLGFTALPVGFFAILVVMLGGYLGLVEFAKRRFYLARGHPRRPRPTHTERHHRRVGRRAARFRRTTVVAVGRG
jgi:Mg2+-importing ATPase